MKKIVRIIFFILINITFSCTSTYYQKADIISEKRLPGLAFFILNNNGRLGSVPFRDYSSLLYQILKLNGLKPTDYFSADFYILLSVYTGDRAVGLHYDYNYDRTEGTTYWIGPETVKRFLIIELTYIDGTVYRGDNGFKKVIKEIFFYYPYDENKSEYTLFEECMKRNVLPKRRRLK